jgi:hypothetical protein
LKETANTTNTNEGNVQPYAALGKGLLGVGPELYFLNEEQLNDREWMSNLIQLTASELPAPKPRKAKA